MRTDTTASRRAISSRLRTDIWLAGGYLKGQIDASHRRDAGVKTSVSQSDQRVHREQQSCL